MTTTGHLAGIKLVLTGDFEAHSRDAATRLLEECGADVTGSVSGKTHAVIVGTDPGATKLSAAQKKGLPLLNEAQLLELLGGKTLTEVLGGAQPSAAPVAAEAAAPAAEKPKDKARAGKKDAAPKVAEPLREVPSPSGIPYPLVPRPRDGEHVEHFPGTLQVRAIGALKGGLREGIWKTYFANGQLETEAGWQKGILDGPYVRFDEKGTLLERGSYRKNSRYGEWTNRYQTTITTQTFDEAGKRQGAIHAEYHDGTPALRGQFVDDKGEGQWTEWKTKDGFARREVGKHRDEKHGQETCWHESGQVAERLTWHLGYKHGLEENFDAEGRPTFVGEWTYGALFGEYTEWDEARKETRCRRECGLPPELIADEKIRANVLKALKKSEDIYATEGAFTDNVPRGWEGLYLLYLQRQGHYDLGADPYLLQVCPKWGVGYYLSGSELVKMMQTAKPFAPIEGNLVPGWPQGLDAIALEVYRRDPEPIEQAYESLPPIMKKGIALVRARYGKEIGDVLRGDAAAIAEAQVRNHHIAYVSWPDEIGLPRETGISQFHGGRTPQYEKLLSLFGKAEFAAELAKLGASADDQVLRSDQTLYSFREAFEIASPEAVIKMIDGVMAVSSSARYDYLGLYTALREWRKGDAAGVRQIALGLGKEVPRWPAVCAAIEAYADAGQEVPADLLSALELEAGAPSGTDWITMPLRALPSEQQNDPLYQVAYLEEAPGVGLPPAQRALLDTLRRVPEAYRRELLEKTLLESVDKVAPYLHSVDDPAFWERVLDRAEETGRHYEPVAYGLGEVGLRVVPSLLKRQKATKQKEWKETYGKAMVVALARAAVDQGDFPAEYDGLAAFDAVKDEFYWPTYAIFYARILMRIPRPHAEALLFAGLSADSAPLFARAFEMVNLVPTRPVLSKAMSALVALEGKLKSKQLSAIKRGLSRLSNRVDWVRWLLQSGCGNVAGDAMRDALGYDAFTKVKQEIATSGAPAPAPLDDVEKLRRWAVEEGGKGDKIYLLRRVASAGATCNVIGGAAPGVDSSRWPTTDEGPMAHLFTLDLDTMPELRARVGAEVRAVSIFCWNPDSNSATDASTDQTAVVLTTLAQLQAGGTPPANVEVRSAGAFEAVGLEVNRALWEGQSELREELLRAHARVGGEPLWIQAGEASGQFLLQFDEQFCPMNLGDQGVMYVFAGTAFWQCG